VVADKRMNTIFVCFRGTYSPKSALSYLQVKTLAPTKICEDTEDGYLLGVFKITAEVFYTIRESIRYLSKHFLKTKDFKLVTTGHSLGGAMASVFSYLWTQKHKQHLKIICITFGSPRVMNGFLIKKFNELIHDKIIMYRRYISNGDPFVKLPLTTKKFENSYYFPDNYDHSLDYVAIRCNYIKKTNPNNITGMKQLEAVRDYFLYICNWEKDYYINQLILDDMKKIRPDIILVPAFQGSWSSPSHPTSYLNQISDMEIKHWNLSQDDVSSATGYVDCRKCHMSERNNQILFEKSLKWLKGDPVEFDLSDFEKPTEQREKYFPTRKEWEMRFSNK
jgi:hypothetical protein